MSVQLKWYLAALWTGLAIIFAPPFGLIIGLLVLLMLADVLATLVANGKAGTVDPQAGWLGWRRKTTTLILLVALAVLWQIGQLSVGVDLGVIPAPSAAAGVFAVFEFLSVLRNARKTGALPAIVDRLFEGLEQRQSKTPPVARQE